MARGRFYTWVQAPDNVWKPFAGLWVAVVIIFAATTAAFAVVREVWTAFAGFAVYVGLAACWVVTLEVSRAAGGLERAQVSLADLASQERARALGPDSDPRQWSPWASRSFVRGFALLVASMLGLAIACGLITAAVEAVSLALLLIFTTALATITGVAGGVGLMRRGAQGQ